MSTAVGRTPVRRATVADVPAVRDLVRAAGLPLDGLDDAHVVVVAELDGEIVGTAALERHEDEGGPAFLLRSVAVAEAARAHGLGSALVDCILSFADARTALLTETAADYFAARGFAPVDRSELPTALMASEELRGACPASAVAMVRG